MTNLITLTGLLIFNIIFFLLYRLFQSISEKEIFTLKNCKRIKLIGFFILFQPIFSIIVTFFSKYPEISQWFNNPLYFDFISLFIERIQYFVFALIIFSLAEVFHQGVLLKIDNDLQI